MCNIKKYQENSLMTKINCSSLILKNIVIDVKNQASNVNNVLLLNERTNKKNESKFETIFETLYQQHLIKLSEIIIYDAIDFKF